MRQAGQRSMVPLGHILGPDSVRRKLSPTCPRGIPPDSFQPLPVTSFPIFLGNLHANHGFGLGRGLGLKGLREPPPEPGGKSVSLCRLVSAPLEVLRPPPRSLQVPGSVLWTLFLSFSPGLVFLDPKLPWVSPGPCHSPQCP